VESRRHKHEALRPRPDQAGENIGTGGVDGEYAGPAFLCLAIGASIEAGVMDHRVETSESIDIFSHFLGLRNVGEVGHHAGLRAGTSSSRILGSLLVASMEDHRVASLDKRLGSEGAETVRRASDQDSSHRRGSASLGMANVKKDF
jgi:hypothetical protein